jgi:hypothetical protein
VKDAGSSLTPEEEERKLRIEAELPIEVVEKFRASARNEVEEAQRTDLLCSRDTASSSTGAAKDALDKKRSSRFSMFKRKAAKVPEKGDSLASLVEGESDDILASLKQREEVLKECDGEDIVQMELSVSMKEGSGCKRNPTITVHLEKGPFLMFSIGGDITARVYASKRQVQAKLTCLELLDCRAKVPQCAKMLSACSRIDLGGNEEGIVILMAQVQAAGSMEVSLETASFQFVYSKTVVESVLDIVRNVPQSQKDFVVSKASQLSREKAAELAKMSADRDARWEKRQKINAIIFIRTPYFIFPQYKGLVFQTVFRFCVIHIDCTCICIICIHYIHACMYVCMHAFMYEFSDLMFLCSTKQR